MVYYWYNRKAWPGSLNSLYRTAKITKQGFHKKLKRRTFYKEEESYLLEIIRQIRKDHPTMCCRSMYFKINPVFIGRDRFEDLCRAHGFMVSRRKNGRQTTDSDGVKRFNNLLIDIELVQINQAWSSDITYFEVDNSFYYITFILDCFSRLIVGYNVSSRLFTEQTTLPALRQALKFRNNNIPPGMIFHSDGGGQYYDQTFLALTGQYGILNSMCKHAYENGKAERINGVIKNNYLKHWSIHSLQDLTKSVDRAVRLYNEDKPHSCLQRLTPKQFESNFCNLEMQNKSMIKESFDAKIQIVGASSPLLSEQNKSQNQDVYSANR